MIIDAHMHMDEDMEVLSMLCDCRGTPAELSGLMDRYGIDGAVILTVSSAGNRHDTLAELE